MQVRVAQLSELPPCEQQHPLAQADEENACDQHEKEGGDGGVEFQIEGQSFRFALRFWNFQNERVAFGKIPSRFGFVYHVLSFGQGRAGASNKSNVGV